MWQHCAYKIEMSKKKKPLIALLGKATLTFYLRRQKN